MNINFHRQLRYLAILGDVLFILWVSFNGIDEGFSGTIYQKLSYIGLVSLLILNIGLLYPKK
ncbi:MAG: hypothetical protein ABSC49_01640 [Candidatus Microgenomates bacterium]|jgi:hypothetical protein